MKHLAELRIDLSALSQNLNSICGQLQTQTRVMAMIKSDAYGHGSVRVAKHLHTIGVDCFGVANLKEAKKLREADLRDQIVVFQPEFRVQASDYTKYNFEAVISHADDLDCLAEGTRFHLLLDTGLGRAGFPWQDFSDLCTTLAQQKTLKWVGLATHFACADENDLVHARKQLARFEQVINSMPAKLRKSLQVHAANSGAIVNLPDSHFDMVRPGIALYGQYQGNGLIAQKPIMKVVAQLCLVKRLQPGDSVGYGATFVAKKEMVTGLCAIGYGDGLSRIHGGPISVAFRGQITPVLGRVSMDQLVFDLSGFDRPQLGEEVIIFDDQPQSISISDDAKRLDTIAYERCCQLGMRLPRVYLGA